MTETIADATEVTSQAFTELVDDQPPIDLSNAENVMWAFRRLRDAQSRIAEEHATGEAMRAKIRKELEAIDEWERHATASDVSFVTFLTAQLEIHMRHRRAADPECKSIKTPWGEITSREQQPDFKRDDAVLLEWAEEHEGDDHGSLTRVQPTPAPEPDWKAIKALCHVNGEHLVTPEGEVVPGVEVIEKPLKVQVEIYA